MKHFIAEQEPNADGLLILSGKAYAYLARVRRIKAGSVLTVLCPKSGRRHMTVIQVDGQKHKLVLHQQTVCSTQMLSPLQALPTCKIILLQWLLKGEKNTLIIRQATEAGVFRIIPVLGDFSISKYKNTDKIERYRRVIKEARQQSGSLQETDITDPQPLVQALQTMRTLIQNQPTFLGLCSEKAENSISVHEGIANHPPYAVLAIGAEGGISAEEQTLLKQEGFQSIHFKTNVLRAETAALYAIATVQTISNEAEQWQLSEHIC